LLSAKRRLKLVINIELLNIWKEAAKYDPVYVGKESNRAYL
jgi:hypothetical protein